MHTAAAAMGLLAFASAIPANGLLDGEPAEDEQLTEIVVTAPEPLYVAPTTRDRIGRVWVPVQVDGQGPFRLVLDTGAQRSAVTKETARKLGLSQDVSPPVLLHGATGSAITPTVSVETLRVGDLLLQPASMPVVADVFGGAEGLLGVDGMQDHRIFIDFGNDLISISRSRNRRVEAGFTAVSFLPDRKNLLVVRARVNNLSVRAIIDTGAQATVGNIALQRALRKRLKRDVVGPDRIQGATGEWQEGVGTRSTEIRLGDLIVRDAHVTFADLRIFENWEMNDEPALMIGMDLIGLVDQLVIDYRRRELHIKPRDH
jgi:predicted aspartyl protease